MNVNQFRELRKQNSDFDSPKTIFDPDFERKESLRILADGRRSGAERSSNASSYTLPSALPRHQVRLGPNQHHSQSITTHKNAS